MKLWFLLHKRGAIYPIMGLLAKTQREWKIGPKYWGEGRMVLSNGSEEVKSWIFLRSLLTEACFIWVDNSWDSFLCVVG